MDSNSNNLSDNKNLIQTATNVEDGDISFFKLSYETLTLAFPTILLFFCLMIQENLLISFISLKYNSLEQEYVINGIGISNVYFNTTLLSLSAGMLTGFNVVAGNAFALKKFKLLGIYIHRALVIGFIFIFTSVIIHNFTMQYAFDLLGATEKSIKYAMEYARISMYFVVFECMFNISYRYLNIASKGYVTIITLLVTSIINPLLTWVFITKTDLGVKGGALSLVLGQLFNALPLIVFIIYIKPIENTIFWFNKFSFRSLWPYIKICLPNAIIFACEWWSYEILQIILTNTYRKEPDRSNEISAHVISCQIMNVFFSIINGFSISTNTLVSEFIAIGKIKDLKKTVIVNLILMMPIIIVLSILLFIFRDVAFSFYTDNEEIINKGSSVIPFIILTTLMFSIQSIYQNAIIGVRKQTFATVVVFFDLYIITLGFAMFLMMNLDLGAKGAWISLSIGYFINLLVFLVYYYIFLDFENAVKLTVYLINEENKEISELLEEKIEEEDDQKILIKK